jgi:hypothetical protein
VVLTTEGHPLPPHPLSEAERAELFESSSSSSFSPPSSCSRLCSSLSPSDQPSSLSISRSLSAAMPLLSPTESDVEALRRRRCSACLAVEKAMPPVREQWAREMKGAEEAAGVAMAKAERAAAEMKKKKRKETKSGGSSLEQTTSSSSLEFLLQQQQQQQLKEQRQLLQQLQFLQQQQSQQRQQRPPVAQVLCRLQEVVAAGSSSGSGSSPSSPNSIACGSLTLVPREQMPIRPGLVPAETLVLQVVPAAAGEAAAAVAEEEEGAGEEETCPAGDGDDKKSSPLPPREWRLGLQVSSSSSSISAPLLSLSGYSAEFGPSLASAAECEEGSGQGNSSSESRNSNSHRSCSLAGSLVASRPANACAPLLTFDPPIPPDSADAFIVVVERGGCDFEEKVAAVARALLPRNGGEGEKANADAAAAAAATAVAVVVLSDEDLHLSMGRSLRLLPSSSEREEPAIPSMLLPKSQAEKLLSAMGEKKGEEGSFLRAELRTLKPPTATEAAEAGGSGGGDDSFTPPPQLLGPVEGSGVSSPNLGTVSISALAPPSAAAWLNERRDGSRGGGGEGSEISSSNSLALQQLLASVARSREFAALLQKVAREETEVEELE